ncbi:hypothetical protein PybrP1_012042, partial [[Pythium] brassicae (nom. inval.)]
MASPPPPPSRGTLRVLCLHGFRTNARVMQDQMRGLRDTLGPNTEFVYLNGPFKATEKAVAIVEEQYGGSRPFYEWLQYYPRDSMQPTNLSPAEIARIRAKTGWDDDWPLNYGGVDVALTYLHAKLRELGPFDVAVGFSQGGVLLTIFAMWSLQNFGKRWWRLLVTVTTSRIHGANCKPLFLTPDGREILVPFPSVHLIGKKDPDRLESVKLAAMFDSFPAGAPTGKVVLEHEEDHRFPSFKRHRQLYETLAGIMN